MGGTRWYVRARIRNSQKAESHLGRYVQDAQLSQRDRAAGCVIVLAKSGRLQLGDNMLWTL